jgi:hypothetical protein
MDGKSIQGGWSDMVASLEERFASGRRMTHNTQGTTEDSHRYDFLASNPAIAVSIDNITCLPSEDDYPLWQVRCKVSPILHI